MVRPKGLTVVAFLDLAYGGLNAILGLTVLIGVLVELMDPQGGQALDKEIPLLYDPNRSVYDLVMILKVMLFCLLLSALGLGIGIGLVKAKKWVFNFLLLCLPMLLTSVSGRGGMAQPIDWLFGTMNLGLLFYLNRSEVQKQMLGFEFEGSLWHTNVLRTTLGLSNSKSSKSGCEEERKNQ